MTAAVYLKKLLDAGFRMISFRIPCDPDPLNGRMIERRVSVGDTVTPCCHIEDLIVLAK